MNGINNGSEELITEDEWIKETKSWYVSDEALEYLDLTITISAHGALSLAGVVLSVINMMIFNKLGLRNSNNVGLFTLSLTDFFVTAIQVAICICYLVQRAYPGCLIDPWMLGGYLFSWARYVAYLVSCWITTMLSVERCFCVVYPFAVHRVFTQSRCIITLLILYLVHIAIHLPIFIYAQLEWVQKTSAGDNMTLIQASVLTVKFNEESAMSEILADMIAGIGLSLISQVLLFICTTWMIFSLKASSKIRLGRDDDKSKRSEANMSKKERRMAKTVLLLAIIVSICNIPRFMTTAVHHILPGMNRGAFQNLEKILWEISYLFGTACCTCNIFVYLKLHSNFRHIFNLISALKWKD